MENPPPQASPLPTSSAAAPGINVEIWGIVLMPENEELPRNPLPELQRGGKDNLSMEKEGGIQPNQQNAPRFCLVVCFFFASVFPGFLLPPLL